MDAYLKQVEEAKKRDHRLLGKQLRRTIYYEFRPAEEILADGPWDEAWIERRMRLIPLGLAAHRRAYPEREQFAWCADERFRPRPLGAEATELKVAHEVHMSGAYCSAGDAGRGGGDSRLPAAAANGSRSRMSAANCSG